ncbi:MAG TPA: glutamine-hydrolyzing GMP synthase [Planctomycetota bacterium]|nr:glutamine-hydrolyzing GMP synthase [Planctomycetota bacterium]
MSQTKHETVVVLDFGAQYSQLIARRVRENHVFCTILPYNVALDRLEKTAPKGIILSGGPASVYAPGAPRIDAGVLRMGVPVLGICYGMQLGCELLGGRVRAAAGREYGRTTGKVVDHDELFAGLPDELQLWMSHGDSVTELSDDFMPLVSTASTRYAAVKHRSAPFYGVQFHPEVTHTPEGPAMLRNFLVHVCGCRCDWTMANFVTETTEAVRARVGSDNVVLGLSGGVDSTVVAALLSRAIGDQLHCIFVDNGLLRKDEAERVKGRFKQALALNLHTVDAADLFLEELAGVTDPEEKRRIIGHTFVDVFREEARKIHGARFLAQGTLYPDVIESVSARGGPSATIKTHHNVGGLPAELGFELLEPVKELFKDEVRQIGLELGLPEWAVWRHPFPGPGLAVRIIGPVTRESLDVLREADSIVIEEMHRSGWYRRVWQAFAVLLPVRTVGVMGDERTYENVIALRVVQSDDAMTADWVHLPYDFLGHISNRIINEVKGVNRVVYDVSSKPPSTIEWE